MYTYSIVGLGGHDCLYCLHFASVWKVQLYRRDTQTALCKLEAMQSLLASTFQLWLTNADELVTNAEGLAFLHSMKGDRAASFGAYDKSLAKKISRRHVREAAALERMKRPYIDIEASKATVSSQFLTDEVESNADDSIDECNDPLSADEDEAANADGKAKQMNQLQRKKSTGTIAFIPLDVLSRPNLVVLATRLKMTPMQQAAFTQAVIVESGGDLSKVASSYATADRSRHRLVSEIATNICNDQSCNQVTKAKSQASLKSQSPSLKSSRKS